MIDDIEEWDDEQEGSHKFLLFWDIFGLESAINLDQIVQHRTEAVLKDEQPTEPDLVALINMLELRARFNPDRQYELYAIGLPAHYTQDEVHDLFEQDAQAMADLVRSRGVKLLGKRHRPAVVIK